MCALPDTLATHSLIVSLFLFCCGLAASWLDNVVSSAFTRQTKAVLPFPSLSLWPSLEHETL